MAAPTPTGGLRLLQHRPWLRSLRCTSRPLSTLVASSSLQHSEESTTAATPDREKTAKPEKFPFSYFPKRGQTLELVCESLAFKGRGVCKVADTGYVVMCDGALPGEKFIGRVTRKKDNYAEVKKLETITPHWDYVEAPCEHSSHCGGCKTQNLLYEVQVRAKEQQVHELIVHVGKFSGKDLEKSGIMKPIVPCDIQFHYRNKFYRLIWKEPIPPKVQVFSWIVYLGKAQTCDSLHRRWTLCALCPSWCVLCRTSLENQDHLFFHRPFSYVIWSRFMAELSLSLAAPRAASDLLILDFKRTLGKRVKSFYILVHLAGVE